MALCSNNALASIWADQSTAFQQDSSSHDVKLWVVPAVDDDSKAELLDGSSYNLMSHQQMADFVTAVQASAAPCCVPGMSVQVSCNQRSCVALPPGPYLAGLLIQLTMYSLLSIHLGHCCRESWQMRLAMSLLPWLEMASSCTDCTS